MELTNPTVIRSLFEKHGFDFSKTLGQNFLINKNIPVKIAEAALPEKGGTVLEIGTGIGCLTKELCLRADMLYAYEIDRGLMPILEETLAEFPNKKIIFEDVLKADIHGLCRENNIEKLSVCANLPYYITTPIIMTLLENDYPIDSLTVMVQKELAQRFCSKAGSKEYGSVTASINYYAKVSSLFNVSAGSFMPAPKVDSTVIRLEIIPEKDRIKVKDKAILFRVIRAAFAMRRKTLVNNLSSEFGVTKEKAAEVITAAGFESNIRGEALGLCDFAKIADQLCQAM